jgi:hypothetical protein
MSLRLGLLLLPAMMTLCGRAPFAQWKNAATGAGPHAAYSQLNPSAESGRVRHTRRSTLLSSEPLAPAGLRPMLDVSSRYVGPSDPSSPSRPLICNPVVRRTIDLAWEASVLAAHRPPIEVNNKVEFGFAVDVRESDRSLYVEAMQSSDLTGGKSNELEIPVGEATIATVHTHNTGARPTPSAIDVKSELPAFVRSRCHLFVTIPGTSHFAEIEPKRVCRRN